MRDRDSSVIADRLPSQKVKENSERSPGRDRLFTGRIVLLPHPFIPPPVYRYPTCVRSRGAARAALAGTRRNLVGVDQIGFHPSLQDSAYRGILLILLFACFHMSDLHVMLAFMFNYIKFKCFTCLPPRDPVQ